MWAGLKADSSSGECVKCASPAIAPPQPDEGPEGSHHPGIDLLGPEQNMGPSAPGTDRDGHRRGPSAGGVLPGGLRVHGPVGPAAGPGRDHRGDLGPRVPVPVLLRGPVEEPSTDRPARAQDGCLQAHPGPRDAVVLRAEHRRPDGDNERRREPTREVPRPRGERPPAGGHHGDSGQRHHVLPRPGGSAPRNHPSPRDSRRVLLLPEADRRQVL